MKYFLGAKYLIGFLSRGAVNLPEGPFEPCRAVLSIELFGVLVVFIKCHNPPLALVMTKYHPLHYHHHPKHKMVHFQRFIHSGR